MAVGVTPAAPGGAGVVGLLHTVPALASRFDADVDAAAPGLRRVHVVDAWLLATAVATGVTDGVRAAVLGHVRHLEALGARAVLVTCSSIGEAAEDAGARVAVPVLRVDAAMAREAIALAGPGGRVAVLATLASTLGPTGRLVERAARDTGVAGTLRVAAEVVPEAAAARAAGDAARADDLVAAAVARAAAGADVVVLAQASMADAAARAAAGAPVLTSPAGGVADLVRVVTAGGHAPGDG